MAHKCLTELRCIAPIVAASSSVARRVRTVGAGIARVRPNVQVERPAATAARTKKARAGGSARTRGWASLCAWRDAEPKRQLAQRTRDDRSDSQSRQPPPKRSDCLPGATTRDRAAHAASPKPQPNQLAARKRGAHRVRTGRSETTLATIACTSAIDGASERGPTSKLSGPRPPIFGRRTAPPAGPLERRVGPRCIHRGNPEPKLVVAQRRLDHRRSGLS